MYIYLGLIQVLRKHNLQHELKHQLIDKLWFYSWESELEIVI